MKKLIALLLAAVMCVSVLSGMTFAAEATDAPNDLADYLWEIPDGVSDDEYITLMTRNFRIIQAFELLLTEDSYKEYSKAYKQYRKNQKMADAQAVVAAQSTLVQKQSIADGAWFLWGISPEDNANGYAWLSDKVAPTVNGETYTVEELDASEIDGYGQAPVLIKILQDDPSQAKGNIIFVSGGGYTTRSNFAEGYAGVKCFFAKGYNCFLLQRRVAPYSEQDIWMDMQRAIRLVRYNAAQEGWGGQDMIAASGYSGGGRTIIGSVRTAYGYLTPVDEGATAYIPDEIDAVCSDLDVALIAYGNSDGKLYPEENPNWPATYITYGLNDSENVQNGCEGLYEEIKDVVPAQIFAIEGAGHGFGVGQASNVPEICAEWPGQADEFMMANRGFSGNGTAVPGILEKYTKFKEFYGIYTFTESDVYYAMNDDETEFHAEYKVMSRDNVIEGTVADGVVTVTYNKIGFADDDAQMMYEDAMDDDSEWELINK